MSRPPYTVAEACQALGVSDKTARRLLADKTLREVGRDERGRILIDPASIEVAAVSLGRAVTAREEIRELAPAINDTALANRVAVDALAHVVEQQNQRIYELQQRVAELEAERKYLPPPERVSALEAEVARLHAEAEQRQALDQTPDQLTRQAENGSQRPWWRRWLGID
jgi:excisionase family DNA binding protein